jgi:hypothetical protein
MLFQRGVVQDREELGAAYKKWSPLKKGDEGGFEGARVNLNDGNRSWLLVEPMNSIATQSLEGEDGWLMKSLRIIKAIKTPAS